MVLSVLSILILSGCEKRFDTSVLPNPKSVVNPGDTTYVEVFPPWGGFDDPRAIIVGRDQLIYVADYGRNEVVMLDAGGARLGSISVPHPISLAQNSKLDLYVGGEAIAPNGVDTLGAIYRIFLVRFDTTYVAGYDTVIRFGDTTIVPVLRDTSFFNDHKIEAARSKIAWKEASRPHRRYVGIGILPDNGFLAARVGPDNSSFVDPDCRVLLFNRGDTLITPLGDLITRPSGGTAITDIRTLTGIMVFPSTRNFILTQTTDGVVYGAIFMLYLKNKDFEGWLPAFDPGNIDTRNADFIRPYRYQNAVAATFDPRRQDVFILDAGLDSVSKFNIRGQFRQESFGKFLTSQSGFPGLNHPMGIAFSNDCTLYISDTGNKVIRRFKLSIQTTCF